MKKFDIRIVVVTTLIGGLSALLLALFFSIAPADATAQQSMLHLGTLEESLKFIVVIVSAGIFGMYAFSPITIAAGFGFGEAVVRVSLQGVVSPLPIFVHIMTGVAMAMFLTVAMKRRTVQEKIAFQSLALFVPAVLHLAYNISIVPLLVPLLS